MDKTTCEAPCTITITNNSSNAVSYRWDFGNGQSSEAQNPNKIAYTAPGMYSIQLIAIGEEGLKDTVVVVVSIAEKGKPPVAKFSVSNNNCTAPCDPGFVNESLNGSTYLWEFGSPDSTSTAMSPQYTFKKGGDYPVKLIVSNTFGSDTTTVIVKIMDRPTVKACFTYTAGTLVAPATVTFDATCSTPNAIYTWDFGDVDNISNTAAGQKAQHKFTNAGKYKVKLSVNLNSITAEQIQEIDVKEEPVLADFSFSSSNDGFIPTTITFNNKSSDNATGFQWNFGDLNSVSSVKNPSHTFNAPGTYIISLTATSTSGAKNVKKDTLVLKYRTFAIKFDKLGSALSVLPTLDGGYLITTTWGWIKTDHTGKQEWETNLLSVFKDFADPKAAQAANGDYYLAHEYKDNSNFRRIRVMKLNSTGTYQKDQTLNTSVQFDDALGDILINKDNQLLLYGAFTNTTMSPPRPEARWYRLDLNLISNPILLASIPDIISVSEVDALQAADGKYLGIQYIAGSTKKYSLFIWGTNPTFYRKQDISDFSILADATQLPNGNIALVGTNNTSKAFISTYLFGNLVQNNAREYNYSSSNFNGITNTTDGQIITCGKGELFLTKINAADLVEIWHKPSSKFSNATANGIANTKDGGYIIAGSIPEGPNTKIYLVKTDPNGEL